MTGLLDTIRGAGFMPHGHCYGWRPDIVALHVLSDALISLSYMVIPVGLLYFVRHRRDLPFTWIFWCFGLFIVSCGLTHVMEIVTLWIPAYWVAGSVKAVTAAASVTTAVLLTRLIPIALTLPSPAALRAAHEALATSEARFRAATEASQDAFFLLDAVRDQDERLVDFHFVEANPRTAALMETGREALIGQMLGARHAGRPSLDLFAEFARVVATGTPLDTEHEIPRDGAPSQWLRLQAVRVGDGVAVTARDISAARAAQQAMARLAAIVATSHNAILSVTPDGRIESWNAGATRLFGHEADEIVGQPFATLAGPDAPDEIPGLLARFREGQTVDGFETKRVRKDGRTVEVELSFSPVRDVAGDIVALSAIGEDISGRKHAERVLRASLDEKVVLLKEVHHRVKNNLQVISSLLSLQSRHVVDPRAREVFRDSQQRVRSIATLHERLYQSRDFARIDMADYFRHVGNALIRTYALGSTPALEIDVEEVGIGLDSAVPLGLIVSELVTNALKYGMTEGRDGRIAVTLHKDGVEGFLLTVRDQGPGLPPDFDPTTAKSLGLHVVRTLSEQVGGTLTHRNDGGAVFELRAPIADGTRR